MTRETRRQRRLDREDRAHALAVRYLNAECRWWRMTPRAWAAAWRMSANRDEYPPRFP